MPAEVATLEDLARLLARIEALEARLAQPPAPEWLDYEAASKFTGLKVNTLRWKKSNGELHPQRYRGRQPLFHRRYLELVQAGTPEPEARREVGTRLITGNNGQVSTY